MSKSLSGAKAALKINGVKVAFVSGLTVNEQNPLEDINVLDQLEVAEHVETGHIVSASCTLYKIDGNSAAQIGLRPTNIRDLLTQGEATLDVYNSVEDRIEYTISGVKWEGGSGTVNARGVWEGNWNFKGRIGGGAETASL